MPSRHPRFGPLVALAAVACGGGTGSGPAASAPPARRAAVELPTDRMAGQSVFDVAGRQLTCAPPDRSCAPADVPVEFKDRCKLAGYRLMQCGCDVVCTGNVAGGPRGWDAENHEKPCAPARADCAPPETSAAYQDACAESGHRFIVCGCEWLCSGPLKRPVAAHPPAD